MHDQPETVSDLWEQLAAQPAAALPTYPFTFSDGTVDRKWLGPLLEAATAVALNTQTWRAAKYMTEWDPSLPENEKPDEEKHGAYGAYMISVLTERMPWLLSLLHAAGATILFSQGLCTFVAPTRLGETFDIPELVPYSWLLPWSEDEDRAHAQ